METSGQYGKKVKYKKHENWKLLKKGNCINGFQYNYKPVNPEIINSYTTHSEVLSLVFI